MKRCPLDAVGLISPIILMPHTAKGQGAVKMFRGTGGSSPYQHIVYKIAFFVFVGLKKFLFENFDRMKCLEKLCSKSVSVKCFCFF